MRQQTFISKILDENGKSVDFERWSYKRLQTVERKVKELYGSHGNACYYRKLIEESKYIAFYEASNNEKQVEIKRYSLSEFLA